MPPKTQGKCANCNKNADEQKCHLMIRCDCCEAWYHSQCQDLTKAEANLISCADMKGVRWFCTKCSPILIIKTSAQASTTEDKLEAINHPVRILTKKFENEFTGKSNLSASNTPYRDALKSNTDEIMKTVTENTVNIKRSQEMLQQSLDNADTEARKMNAILYGLKENTEKPVLNQIEEFLNKECFSHLSGPTSAYRLGVKKDDNSRPIKIKFEGETEKWEFLRRVNHNLKGTPIFCLLDRPKAQRDEEFKLRQAVKKLSTENPGSKFRTREMSIQVRNEQGEWKRLKQGSLGEWSIPQPAHNQSAHNA